MLNKFSPEVKEASLYKWARATESRRAARRMFPVLLLLVLPLAAQSPGMPALPAPEGIALQREVDRPGGAGIDARMEARRFAALNQQRQHEMVADANKLLKLARELSDDADAGGTILSEPERLRKAEDIQKLAKQVKEKMTFAIGAPQDVMGPFAAWQR